MSSNPNKSGRAHCARTQKKMPRCCDSSPSDFAPCYASVLVAGEPSRLPTVVEDMESDSRICPCVTGWCRDCKRVSTLTVGTYFFPCRSAYFAHALVLHAKLEESLAHLGP